MFNINIARTLIKIWFHIFLFVINFELDKAYYNWSPDQVYRKKVCGWSYGQQVQRIIFLESRELSSSNEASGCSTLRQL